MLLDFCHLSTELETFFRIVVVSAKWANDCPFTILRLRPVPLGSIMSKMDYTRLPIFEVVRSASLDVIVKNFKKYSKHKIEKRISATLSSYCKNILLNQVITDNTNISLAPFKLGKVYEISDIIVKKLQTKNGSSSGIITESTKIHIMTVHSEEYHHLSMAVETLPQLGGLEQEFQKIERLFYINRLPTKFYKPLGILLHGPPGCGKTSFGKNLAKKLGATFYNVEPSNLLNSDFGTGAVYLKEFFQKAIFLLEEGPVILFLDEIDMLCPRQETASLGNRQLSNALRTEMDSIHIEKLRGLIIVATTNSISSVDPRLRRPGYFDQEILINVPTEAQRLSILQVLTADLCLASNVSCSSLAHMTPGFVGADLKGLCEEASNHVQTSQVSTEISMEDFDYALHKIIPSLKKGMECVVDLKPVKWAEIGGLEEVKAEIQQSLEWPLKYPEVLRSMDIPPTNGILLYGPPGCCKTTLVRAAATSCNVSFLSLSGAQVYSAYVGESEKLISKAFQKARALAPSILFLDEIESLVGKRRADVGQNRVQERILSTMLNEMDGVGNRLDLKLESSTSSSSNNNCGMQKTFDDNNMGNDDVPVVENKTDGVNSLKVIVVGATNRPDMLDAAILRPGRLDKHIYVPPPDEQARRAILQIYTSKMSTSDVDIDLLACKTDLYSGADLKNLCKEAGLQALRGQLSNMKPSEDQYDVTVTHNHFHQALDKVKPSLSWQMLQEYKK